MSKLQFIRFLEHEFNVFHPRLENGMLRVHIDTAVAAEVDRMVGLVIAAIAHENANQAAKDAADERTRMDFLAKFKRENELD